MTSSKTVQTTERALEEVVVQLEGTAPVLVAHVLPWDAMSYWDTQPAEIAKRKVKRPSAVQLALLAAISDNGYDLPIQPYDEKRGLDAYQETILRGHWLPGDHAPGFPVAGFMGAIATGAVQYNGKNYGLSAKKLRSLNLFGDVQDTSLARIETSGVSFDDDIGKDAGRGAPRHIVRIRYALPWHTELRIRYSAALFTPEQIVQVLQWGGDFGIGQRRPSSPHGGQYGTFRVAEEPVT
jgi:hypothetical protein